MGDVIEAQAIGSVYGQGPWVTGLKSYVGHTMGACGAIEAVITLRLMRERFIPPTLNLEQVDDRCAMIRHSTGLMEKSIKTAVIQNFAFGGVNTCFILRKIEG
jgi:3-oxoacyl-[acyl-carrier-protein] synthase II